MRGKAVMMFVHPKAHKYQKKALEFSLKHPASYQALDMGLGKTLIALLWKINLQVPVLVVAPIKPMYNTWPAEIAKWVPDLTYQILHGPEKSIRLRKQADVYLINFEGLIWLEKELKKLFKQTKRIPFQAIVIDEGSAIKDPKTKRFKALSRLRNLFKKGKIILSATPSPNSLRNLWSQYFFLDNGARLGPRYEHFEMQYFYIIGPYKWAVKPFAEDFIYKAIQDITFRLDATDYIKIPKRINNYIKLSLPKKLHEQYRKLEQEFFLELGSNKSLEVFNSAALSMKLRQFIQGAVYIDKQKNYEVLHSEKLDALKELVSVTDKPILCAIQFRFEYDLIEKAFPKVPIIYGGVSNARATELIKLWNKSELPLLLCHPLSISHGMNLQAGSNIFLWYGLTWSNEQDTQLVGRLARQGQKEEHVIAHYFIMRNTIDIAVAAAIKNRAKSQQDLLDYLYAYRKGELDNELN